MRARRRLSVTKMGRTYLVLTLGVGFGALNTGNNLLYLLLGLMLSAIVASGVLSERNLRHLTVRRLGADSPHAGEPFAFRWVVSRAKGSSFALVLSERGDELGGSGAVAYLRKGEQRTVRGQLVAARRGPIRLSAVEISTTFPLGLFEKTRVFPLEDLLLVFPRRGFSCALPAEAPPSPRGDSAPVPRPGGHGDVHSLRDLLPGEDARRIHWKKSAAVGRLLRVEREREERRSFVLRIEAADAALERRCEEAAEQAARLIAEGHEVGLWTPTSRLRPATGPGQQRRILRALAWVGYEEQRR